MSIVHINYFSLYGIYFLYIFYNNATCLLSGEILFADVDALSIFTCVHI